MKTTRNKARVSRELGPKGPHNVRVKATVHKNPNIAEPEVPGINASPMASHAGLAPGHWPTRPGQRRVGAADKRFKARPWAGATADEWTPAGAPDLSPEDYLAGIRADHFGDGAKRHGTEWDLLAAAYAYLAGARTRKSIKDQADNLIDKFDNPIAKEIAQALNLA